MDIGAALSNLFKKPDPDLAPEHKDSIFDLKSLIPLAMVLAALIWYKDTLIGLVWPIVVLACVYLITACVKTCYLAHLNNDLRKWNTYEGPVENPPKPANTP
jgi:hypothetical protein